METWDIRGRAIALSVREKHLLEKAADELFPNSDPPAGAVIARLAKERVDLSDDRSHSPGGTPVVESSDHR